MKKLNKETRNREIFTRKRKEISNSFTDLDLNEGCLISLALFRSQLSRDELMVSHVLHVSHVKHVDNLKDGS